MLASAQDGAKKDDRIKAARQMYAKLPPIVLGLTEPVKFTYAQVAKDGGSVHIRLEDAKQNARRKRKRGRESIPNNNHRRTNGCS
jgi:hypothetical protein